MRNLLILLLLQVPAFAFSQEFLNLGFEYKTKGQATPQKWRIANDGYEVSIDSVQKYQGSQSLKIESLVDSKDKVGACATSFPVDFAKGKYLKLTGKIKTVAVQKGKAELWLRVDDEKDVLKPDKIHKRGVSGTQNWTKISIEVKVDTNAIEINFGAMVSGEGTAWFDDFELFVGEKKFFDLAPRLLEPTPQELTWLKKYIYPINTVDPDAPEHKDLAVLKKLTSRAQVVAFGEATHGSSEIFKLKHRMIRFLVENSNFNVFSIEANLPESYMVNQYVVNGKGNPRELIKRLYYWTWNTQEVLDMVEWMRISNKTKQFQFTGFDMQFYDGAIHNLQVSFKKQREVVSTVSSLKQGLDYIAYYKQGSLESIALIQQVEKVNSQLSAINRFISTSDFDEQEKKWLLQNVRIIEQYIGNNQTSRDAYMAENFFWIRKQNAGSKFIIWAHNEHIKKSGFSMGKYLANALGKEYLAVGFAFYKGDYTADGKNGLNTYTAQNADIGTYEYFFNAIKVPIFIIDLRAARLDKSENGKWLQQKLGFRNVGSTKMDHEFVDATITEDFDLLVFIRESTSSRLID